MEITKGEEFDRTPTVQGRYGIEYQIIENISDKEMVTTLEKTSGYTKYDSVAKMSGWNVKGDIKRKFSVSFAALIRNLVSFYFLFALQ